MKRLLLYANTLRHLRTSQISALIRKRLLPTATRSLHVNDVQLRAGVGLSSSACRTLPTGRANTFRFLNCEKGFSNARVDWESADMPKLWRYNLHYFDYLSEPGRSHDEKAALISNWIEHNPLGAPDAWEPYTLSLRMVNWIKFFVETKMTIREEWLRSLYIQGLWLEHNIEDHLLANHYLKNSVALFFVGVYFKGADADRWLARGRQILAEQLDEQFLPDGGHYERSPMYHAISLVDYLDVLNLMKGSREAITFDEQGGFTGRVEEALTFLEDVCLPDGNIPLFNDAAFGIAPLPEQILAYGNRIANYRCRPVPKHLTVTDKPYTGYYVIRDRSDVMVIDCGAVGPDYQPGHAHADTLSFELALNGRRVIVDSGVYDYEPGRRRTYARSTKAHNTLCIDHQDQSETWGTFRVARRAYPLYGRLTEAGKSRATFEGAHDGYARLPGRPRHARIIDYASPGNWTIRDTVEGAGSHTIESRLHIHPDYRIVLVDQSAEIRDDEGEVVLIIIPSPNVTVRIEEGWYFPEFGREYASSTLVMTYQGVVPVTLVYRMAKAGPLYSHPPG